MMRTLYLQAPSCDRFDGGAGSRYQARREVRSFWYPTWLAQAAALVPDSKLIDATPHAIDVSAVVNKASQYDLAVLYTSTPSFSSDLCALGALKGCQSRPEGWLCRREGRGRSRRQPHCVGEYRLRCRQRIRVHNQGRCKRVRLVAHQWPLVSRPARYHQTQSATSDARGHGPVAVRDAYIQT